MASQKIENPKATAARARVPMWLMSTIAKIDWFGRHEFICPDGDCEWRDEGNGTYRCMLCHRPLRFAL